MNRLETKRFGEVSFVDSETIEFPWGLPGFAELRKFLALSLAEQPNFVWLQSIDDPNVALPCSDPWQIFPDYDPKLPGYAKAALELEQPDDFTILCVVVVTEEAHEMTMNLIAPVIVNLKTRRGRQIMLENSGYAVREPIPRKGADAKTA
ncbi:MAG TPA: flagellar assembly protein FliW [Candidatus Baltobacteraceae bacterium]